METTSTPAGAIHAPVSESMMNENEEQRGWFAQFWGLILMILIIGSILGLPLWWLWTRTPLRVWIKATLTALLIMGIILII
ncbi:MAG TPA: hypothetical protein VLF88_00955 [Candidatus Babeliales bacterium]|nr:hypothetical protein [Candidatus Babeliales bacterium]